MTVVQQLTQQLINALSLGTIYALFALGYALVFSVLGVLNLAHSAIFTSGAVIGLLLIVYANFPLPLAFVGATRALTEPATGSIAVADVGGGSSELAVGTLDGGMTWSASLRLGSGTLADAYGLIRKAFRSDYVFCGDPNISAQLRAQPGFQQIYPDTQNPGQPLIVPTVFRVEPDSAPELAAALNVSDPGNLGVVRWLPSSRQEHTPAPGPSR